MSVKTSSKHNDWFVTNLTFITTKVDFYDLNIGMLVWEFPPRMVGGLGTYAAEVTRRFVRKGHQVWVLTLNESDLVTSEDWHGVQVHRPVVVNFLDSIPDVLATPISQWRRGAMFFSNILIYNVLSASKLVNELVRKWGIDFDVISAHDWLSIMGGIAIKRELELPLVFHVHSTEQGRQLGRGSPVVIDLERMGGVNADIIVTVSYAMRDEMVGLGFPEKKIRVCYNGVDPRKYDPKKIRSGDVDALRERYGLGQDGEMIFYIGRLVAVKGPDRLVMAMTEVLKQFPETKLVIVGVGEMEGFLSSLIKRLGIEDNVSIRGEFLPEKDRILHFAACNIAVFPSLYEPFGIVCTEAMSMAKPVIVGAKGTSGLREQVIPSGPHQCGIHINPYDPHDIAWGINSVLQDPEYARKLSRNARKRVLNQFTWDKSIDQTLAIYEEATGIE